MATLYPSPLSTIIQALTNLGAPLANGTLGIFQAGSNSTPQTSYTDSTGTTQNAQPIALSSAGRLASSSGAPVGIWVPSNTPHRGELRDASNVLLAGGSALDYLYGINDPSAIQALLLPPTGVVTGTGADLVANAVKAYATFATLRAFGAPTPIYGGQNMIAVVQFGSLLNDGLGGAFYWNAGSSVADDSLNTLKPTGVAGNGRWLRILQPYAEISAAFASNLGGVTLTGFTTVPFVASEYWLDSMPATFSSLNGNTGVTGRVTLELLAGTGTSNSAGMATSALAAVPSGGGGNSVYPVWVEDNGVWSVGFCQFVSNTLVFGKTWPTPGGFTASGTKGFAPFQISYLLGV